MAVGVMAVMVRLIISSSFLPAFLCCPGARACCASAVP